MKAGADLKERRDAPPQDRFAFGGRRDAGEDLEQGRFAGAVRADNADDLSPHDIERYVLKRPELLFPCRVAPLHLVLEKGQRMQEGRGKQVAQGQIPASLVGDVVSFAEIFDLNNGIHGGALCGWSEKREVRLVGFDEPEAVFGESLRDGADALQVAAIIVPFERIAQLIEFYAQYPHWNAIAQNGIDDFILRAFDIELEEVKRGVSVLFHERSYRLARRIKVRFRLLQVQDGMRHVCRIFRRVKALHLIVRPDADGKKADLPVGMLRNVADGTGGRIEYVYGMSEAGEFEVETDVFTSSDQVAERSGF